MSAGEAYGNAARLSAGAQEGDDNGGTNFKVLALTSQGEVLYGANAYAEAAEALQPLFAAAPASIRTQPNSSWQSSSASTRRSTSASVL